MFLEVYKAFVGVYHLLEVYRSVHDMCERVAFVVAFVHLVKRFDIGIALNDDGSEYSSCEISSVGDKIYLAVKVGLQLFDTLQNLWQVLVLERLVYAHVVVSPTEMRGGRRLYSGTGATSDGVDRDVSL